ncbi:uncharacterized protein PV09_05739 [Verruconis gallopava]|uniref:Uncharacterized protein n=1 Tax=Verruconis gallopava TaxID=253628 RepID=A0A0D2AVD5_9PEZI|nr:uncharacterized protein PV09_05739 [Verruconis gallopava]KIW03094.1 hypothetical protein PV09_05739 [Verruconis gallopava]
MSITTCCLPPTSSLPPVRRLKSVTKDELLSALRNIQQIYCPLRLPTVLHRDKPHQPQPVDSGYVSEDEVAQDDVSDVEDHVATIRVDEFERSFTVRWLTALIARGAELPFDEEDTAMIIDQASSILSSFTDPGHDDAEQALTREFAFPNPISSEAVKISLNDAPLSGTDHTDVGLQSWGASIVFSELLCSTPEKFGIDVLPSRAKILELGAGTGLVSLTLAKLLPALSVANPSIAATDFHPTVLDNLRGNIATNFPTGSDAESAPKAMFLDWSAPPSALESTMDMLFAADVVYAPEHARWLRDCAGVLLAPAGVFWLMITLRNHGKFEGISATVGIAFEDAPPLIKNGRALRIIERQLFKKQRGVGRGDETGYMLFKIGWIEC